MGVDEFLLTILKKVFALNFALSVPNANGTNKKIIFQKALTNYVRTVRPANLRDVNDYRAMFGGFGDTVMRQTTDVAQQQQQQQQQQQRQQQPSQHQPSQQPQHHHGHQYASNRFR